jgi:hypothetical protein
MDEPRDSPNQQSLNFERLGITQRWRLVPSHWVCQLNRKLHTPKRTSRYYLTRFLHDLACATKRVESASIFPFPSRIGLSPVPESSSMQELKINSVEI